MGRDEALAYWQDKRELAELEYGELCPQGSEGLEGPGTDCGNCGASHLRSGGLCPICLSRLTALREKAAAPSSPCACGGKEPLAIVRGKLFQEAYVEDGYISDLAIEDWLDLEPQDVRVIILEGKANE